MIHLVLAVLSSVLVSVIMRVSEKHIHNNISMLAANYLMCMSLAAAFTGTFDFLPAGDGLTFCLALGAMSGAFYLGSFMLLQWNVAKNGVVLSSMFMKLGVMVPTLMAMMFFREVPKTAQVVGMMVAVAAILLINLEKGIGKATSSVGLVALLLAGGGTDAMAKIFEELGSPELKNNFLLYTFIVAFLLCVVCALVRGQRMTLADMGFGLLIGVPNYFSARFLLLSLGNVPAVVAYPTYSVGTIVVVALAGVAIFHEKLSRRQFAAMSMILAALVLLNI